MRLKTLRKTVFISILILTPLLSFSNSGTGQFLRDACSQYKHYSTGKVGAFRLDDYTRGTFCISYIQGFLEGAIAQSTVIGTLSGTKLPDYPFCLNKNIGIDSIVRQYISCMKWNPNYLIEDMSVGLTYCLINYYCPNGNEQIK